MGYMDISIVGSDLAAGVMYDIIDAVIKNLRKALREEGNEYNTSGAVNVGLFFEEVICKNTVPWIGNADLYKIAEMTRDRLDTMEIPGAQAANRENWDSESNRKEHLSRYRAIRRAVIKFIDHCDRADEIFKGKFEAIG